MKRSITAVMCVVGALGGREAAAQVVTLEAMPAVVVKAVPEAGTVDVDPGTREIRVTFSKVMTGGSWSWATVNPESFPEMDGTPRFEADKRTAVLPVKLKPGTTYALWVNSRQNANFKDAQGQPSLPYLLVFRTKG